MTSLEWNKDDLYVFGQDGYKWHYNNAVKIISAIYSSRGVKQLNRDMILSDIHNLAIALCQEWLNMEKELKKIRKGENNE